MDALIGVAGIVLAAAITPGPNNFVVMDAATRHGLAGAVPAIVGVLLGSAALITVVLAGAGAAFDAEPRLRMVISWGGGLYLVALGATLALWRSRPDQAQTRRTSAVGLFGFQFLNPKAWVTALTAASAFPAHSAGIAASAYLIALFVLVPAACLILWSSLGWFLTGYLARPRARRWFDRAMGCLLILSAGLLLKS